MFIVIRDENDDLQSVDPATLTLYGRRGLLTESLGSVARKSARIAELEQANAALRRYEAECERAAEILQFNIPAGKVKGIGLLEVAAGIEQLVAELNMFREKLSNFSQEQFNRANHLDM